MWPKRVFFPGIRDYNFLKAHIFLHKAIFDNIHKEAIEIFVMFSNHQCLFIYYLKDFQKNDLVY